MIWLVITTIAVLVAKVVLATLIPSARRRAEEERYRSRQEGEWNGADDMHNCSAAPLRVRVRADDMTGH